jgi:hypothetical protein
VGIVDPAVFLAQPQARSVPLAALVQHVQTAFPGKRITQVSWKEEH